MAVSPQFESDYIRQFAGIVRHGTPALVWYEWPQRVQNALLGIDDPNVRNEAQARFALVLGCAANLTNEPDGGRDYLASELRQFAEYISKIDQ
jgi:hypothetical protein